MSANDKKLPVLSKDVAHQAIQDINILGAHAYADAALHEADKAIHADEFSMPVEFDDVGEAFEAVRSNFQNSKMEKLVDAAFKSLALIIEARSLTNPKPMEREFLIADHLDEIGEYKEQITEAVRTNQLPESVQKQFETGIEIATCENPQQKWLDAVAARKEAGWLSRTGK